MSQEQTPTKAGAASAAPKYKIKSGALSFGFPGLPGVEYTEEHLNGKDGEMIVGVMKKLNSRIFEKLIEVK